MALRSRPSPARVLVAGSVMTLAGASTLVGLSSGASAARATGHPAANTLPVALLTCDQHSFDDSALCLVGALADYDRARALEGLGPMRLPSNYASLTPPQQLLTLTNIDRVDRGLPPIAGLSKSLDTLSAAGADRGDDPSFPANLGLGGVTRYVAGSNWASPVNPLWAEFLWMYDDGLGSGNTLCTSAADPDCWGHRDNILNSALTRSALMGAGTGAKGTGALYVDRDPQYTDVEYAWPGASAGGSAPARHHLVVSGGHARVAGRPAVGKVLTARLPTAHVDRADGPTARGVRAAISWLRDGHRIARAAGRTYRVRAADRGHRVAYRAVFRGSGYTNRPAYTSRSVRVR